VRDEDGVAPSLVDSEITVAAGTSEDDAPMWPPLSPLRPEPVAPDYDVYADKAVREVLKKEHERRAKAWKQAAKDREATLAERRKVEEKMRKASTKAGRSGAKREGEDKAAAAVDMAELPALTASVDGTTEERGGSPPPPAEQKRKDKKFCMLPPKDEAGRRDPTWVRVFMADMDEVTAHTSLFIVSDAYERLVGDVGERIEEWVRESGR
jgi:hypothetical protein